MRAGAGSGGGSGVGGPGGAPRVGWLAVAPVLVGAGVQVLFWGHRLPVVRWGAAALAGLGRWSEPVAGLLVARAVLLLPAASLVVALPAVARRGRRRHVALLLLAALLAVLAVLEAVVLTRGA